MLRNRPLAQLLLLLALANLIRAQADPVAPGQANEQAKGEDKPASLFGLVTNNLTAQPLAHAHVRLHRKLGTGPQDYGAITNEDGHYSITGIPAGTYSLSADHRGYTPVGGVRGADREPEQIVVKPGDEIRDILLQLVPDGVIVGRVVDPEGLPVQSATVEVLSVGPTRSMETDDRGEFRIGGLDSGRYLVKASLVDRRPEEIRTDGTTPLHYGPTYYPSSSSAGSAMPVEVHAGQETADIEVKLLSAPSLHVSGRVFNMPQSPQAYVGVRLSNGLNYPVERDGRFTLWHVPSGRHMLFADYFGDKKPWRSAPAEVDLTDSSVEGINLTLMPRFEVIGQVRMEGEANIASEKGQPFIHLLPLGGFDGREESGSIAADGGFKISDASSNRYHVVIWGLKKNLYVKSFGLGERIAQDGILDLRGGPSNAVLTIQLGLNGAEISGVVYGQKGPAPNAAVSLFFDDEFGFDVLENAATGEGGAYSFHGIAPGKYKLFAYDLKNIGSSWSADAVALYQSVTETIDVGEGGIIAKDLKLLTIQ